MASYLDAGALVTTGIALVLYAPILGKQPLAVGLLAGLLTFCVAIGAVIGGRLGDRFGRRRVFTLTIVLFAIGIVLLFSAVVPAMLFIGVTLAGLAIGADLPVSLALIAEEAPEGKKGKMVATSGILWMSGILVTTIITIFVSPLGVIGGRILYGHLLVVAIVVIVLRVSLTESKEWSLAKRAAEGEDIDGVDDTTIRLSAFRQLFQKPIFTALVATGLFYLTWNLGANTFGQFFSLLYVQAGSTVQVSSMLSLVLFPLGIVGGLIFMRVADKPSRHAWFIVGAVCQMVGFALPLIFGANPVSLGGNLLLFGVGSGFAGESIYRVWSQEVFPTLLRASAQGITLAIARTVAAVFAVVTPALSVGAPAVLYGILTGCAVAMSVIGLVWVFRLPKASELVVADDIDLRAPLGQVVPVETTSI
ncbi:MAG TPA: MFS transporter [Galbitalea sp.]|jgi:inositol transporter-like SP family MFS transporter|nr:MFS transporter [Galbitalea sp.]